MAARRGMLVAHRYLGLAAVAFVLLLALSGMALNHTEALSLDRRTVDNPVILAWYGMESPGIGEAYRSGGRWVVRVGERLYLDEREFYRGSASLNGVLSLPEALVVAADDALLLLTHGGELIERLELVHGLPVGIRMLGTYGKSMAVKTAEGAFVADDSFLLWTPVAEAAVLWHRPESMPEPLAQRLVALQRGKGLTLERVLLDLHSGRLFGRYGVLAMDAAALMLLALAVIGVWLYAKRGRRARSG